MSRTDWISAFVTLIATGIGYFIRGPKVAAGCVVVGIVGTLILHATRRKKQDLPQPQPAPANYPINITVNPNMSQVVNVSPAIPSTVGQPVKANRPKLTFLKWDSQSQTLDIWQSGFYLENHGEAALEVNVQRFEVSPGKFASSKTVATIPAHSQEFAPVWLEGFSSFGFFPEKWDLLGAMKNASDAGDGGLMYRPNYTVTVTASYRDFDDDWYESTSDLSYVPARNELIFGSTNQHGIKRPA